MIAPQIPEDEPVRLQALAALEILDTPPEERYDRLVRLARRTVGVSIAYISFVDENRQWLKSETGMPTCETARDVSFCGHAILEQKPLVIADARLDPRFADNPLVVGEPHIRFYAGVPLRSPDGQPVGTLCVADPRPRELAPEKLELLVEFGALVERELTLVDAIEAQQKLARSHEALARSRTVIAEQLQRASTYVRSLLPKPMTGPVTTRWRFLPSAALGGDAFDTFLLPDGRMVIHLLDVAGHGIGSALLSVSVLNLIRARAVPGADLSQPASVLAGLNRAFPMCDHDNKFFTVWYGVYDPRDRVLEYASGGHPPVLLRRPTEDGFEVERLEAPGMVVGALPDPRWRSRTVEVTEPVDLFLFSDGAYEIFPPGDEDGSGMLGLEALERIVAETGGAGDSDLDRILDRLREHRGSGVFDDDLSLLQIRIGD